MRYTMLLTSLSLASSVVYGFAVRIQPPSTNIMHSYCPSRKNVITSSMQQQQSISLCRNKNKNYYNNLAISQLRGGGGGGGGGGGRAVTVTSDKNSKSTTSTELYLSTFNTGTKCPMTGAATVAASVWGTGGVLYILAKAIKRVIPIALEPFQPGSVPLTQFQLAAYIVTVVWFAYVEGYKGFQTKFSPMVVKRSFTLVPGKNGTKLYHYLIAPFYSMGLLHATRKRQIVSWSVSIGVAAIVSAVKRLPYPYRNIIDAGVVAGLTWGSISIAIIYINSWITGTPPPNTSPELPETTTQ